MDVVTLGAALSIMKKMPDTAASSAAAAEDAADRAEEAARTLTIDDTLTKPGQPADSKAVGDVLAEKLDIADLPNTVSNANQLLSEKYVIDTEPYHLRPSGGNGADREFDTIVGGSVAWNQLVGESDSSVTVISGHKYISKISGSYSVAVSDGTAVAVTGGTDEVFDITQMFGSTIADYIYSLEQTTAGAGVAWFRKYFPNDYYDYNPGELMHVSDLHSHDTVGFNLFDKTVQLTNNYYLDDVGSTVANVSWNITDYIPIVGGQTYYLNFTLGTSPAFCWYDPNKAFISGITGGKAGASKLITAPQNAYFLRASIKATDIDTACINLSWSGTRDGEYEPYVKRSYPLDPSLTLRGIPKLTADGDLTYDGDIYKPDGTVERRYGIVDLGTLNWAYESTFARFYVIPSLGQKKPANNDTVANIICNKYITDTDNATASSSKNMVVGMSRVGRIDIKDSYYTDAVTFKAAMSGVYLVYELATPTAEQADPFQSLQILDPYGTEEYITTSLVPVGHETKYPENLRVKIEGLPWNFASLIAPVEAEFKATQNYTSGSLFIVNNTLYKATANIANGGTITPNTNCTATTLAEIIAAL